MSRKPSVRLPKTEAEFIDLLSEMLKQIFPYVRKEETITMPNSTSVVVDILARSANNRLIVFETKFMAPDRALPYSTVLSISSLKESLTRLMPELPPVVVMLTNGRVEESVKTVFGNAGIPVMSLNEDLSLLGNRLRDSFQQFAIDLPEFSSGIGETKSPRQFCFVSVPLGLKEVYANAIEPAVHRAGLVPISPVQTFDLKHIFEQLFVSSYFIADLTGLNPNALVELGAAVGAHKPTLLLTQRMDEVPFDLRSFRVLHYQNTQKGLAALKVTLAETLVALQQHSPEFTSGIRISDLLRSTGVIRPEKLGDPNAQDSVFLKVVLFLLRTISGRNYLGLMEQFYETLDVAIPVLIQSATFDEFIERATGARPEIEDLPNRAPEKLGPYYSYTVGVSDLKVGTAEKGYVAYATYLKDRRLVVNETAYRSFTLTHESLRSLLEIPE